MRVTRRVFASAALLMAAAGRLAASAPAPPADGVYAVPREAASRAEAEVPGARQVVLVYDQKYSEADRNEPARYVALETAGYVPLVLEGKPNARRDERGWTQLQVTLARDQAKKLEELTRAYLNGRVAIVIGGEVISLHKVRSVITDGKAMITRCHDDACQKLLLKLAR